MSDVKRLLDEATPLPWELLRYGHGGGRFFGGVKGNVLIADLYNEPDRELIAEVITRLPDYEAAVDALERLTALTEGWDEAIAGSEWQERIEEARAALRRLRLAVPA